jgi:hypothetical protein
MIAYDVTINLCVSVHTGRSDLIMVYTLKSNLTDFKP